MSEDGASFFTMKGLQNIVSHPYPNSDSNPYPYPNPDPNPHPYPKLFDLWVRALKLSSPRSEGRPKDFEGEVGE